MGTYADHFQYSVVCNPLVNINSLPLFNPTTIVQMSYASNFGYLSYEKDRLVICFRGSVTTQNWTLEDLRCLWDFVGDIKFLSDFKGQDEYPGWSLALDPFMPTIIEACNQFLIDTPFAKFLTIGHSLGAAMATLCAYRLMKLNYNVSGIGYGTPSPLNLQGAASFNALHIPFVRIRNGRDIVCSLPPEPATPVGQEICIPPHAPGYVWDLVEDHLTYDSALQKAGL